MCWICDRETKAKIAYRHLEEVMANSLHFAEDSYYKDADRLLFTGHDLVPPQLAALILTPDAQPGDITTTATIAVGQTITSTLEMIGDQDFFKVELVAGKTYEIGQYLTTSGPNLVPLADAYLELYDSAGNLIVSADGGGPNTPSGLDALLTYTAEVSGTFYINARSYDQDPINGTTGDFVGDYDLFVREASPYSYKPYYDVNSPLYALDWGSQVDGSSRNPDGQEGPRATGNSFTGHAWNPYGIEGKNVIYYYFAKQGEVFISEDPANPGLENMVASGFRDWEKNAYEMALGEYEKVADIIYIEVSNRNEADFIFITYDGTPNVGVLGRMSPPDEQNEGQTEFNRNGPGWNEQSLKPGGFSFQTLMHELGHGHGMAHPHDGGGRSGVMRGVTAEGAAFDYTTGDFDLNQGIYTIMSYEDGWQTRPAAHGAPPTTSSYGWVGSLSAFDIAVIQDKYGVNEDTATGDDVYVIRDVNADGTYYQTIWDAGGNDTILYSGARDATIDLRAATLKYEEGGGGRVSYALGIHGGYTIANGVTIENATGGSGNDTIFGNDAANTINGGGGADVMTAFGGNDLYIVDNVGDRVVEAAGGGYDAIYSSVSYTLASGQEIETLATLVWESTAAIDLTGNEFANYIIGNAGNNVIDGGGGADVMVGREGDDLYIVDNAGDFVWEDMAGTGNDAIYSSVSYTLAAGSEVETLATLVWESTAAIDLTGNEFYNYIIGNAGSNVLDGKGGADVLIGLGGADTFAFTTALGGGNIDVVHDFEVGIDKIALDDAIFAALSAGTLSADAFVTGSAAQDADDRIIYDPTTGALYYDADGSGAGEAVQFASLSAGLNLSASDFAVI